MRRAPALVAVLVFLLLASACAGPGQPVPAGTPADWAARRDALAALDAWRVRGRIALTAGTEGWQGGLSWAQTGEQLDLHIRGPLGVGGVHIFGSIGLLTVRTSRGEEFLFDGDGGEFERQLGWSLPMHSLRYWMLGVPDPALDAVETIGDDGRLLVLEQLGWRVSYDEYRDFDGTAMPRRLRAQSADVSLRLALDGWRLGALD